MASKPVSAEINLGASSRERLLLSAKKLFAELGYENTATSAIARMAGTSESQLVKHFKSKEGLLEEIFESGWQRINLRVADSLDIADPRERLIKLIEEVFASIDQDEEMKDLMLLESRRIRRDSRHGQIVLITESYKRMIGVVDSILEEMRTRRQLRPEINTQAVRSAISGMAEGMVRDLVLAKREDFPAKFNSQDLRRVLRAFIESLG